MSEKDVVENVDSPGEIGIPIASNSTPGIASFDSNDFTIGTDGKVSSIVERGIPQYLGKITGTGTGTTDLNWEVDTNTVKQNKPIKLGEYIMLTERFNQFVPGDIFRITNVQIEGTKYTVKTNNVRALSLASIVGPQGEQGNEGPQGVPYLAYTGSIESTIDPAPGSIMRLEDGHFNRTPIINAGEYQDVVTVDWYNKTTHKAFMVTGYIQSKDSATNQWVALITAATDITGAVGPQGKEGAGIADIVDIDYPHGKFTSVQYDTTDGIKMRGIAKYLRDDGETYQIPTDINVPLVAGEGVSIDKKEAEEKVEINSLNSNLENGTGTGSLVQKRLKSDGVTWTTAKAYQGASTAFGGGTQAGRTEEEFNSYFWDSVNNVPLHGGQGKTEDGKIKDNRGLTYEQSYSYAVAEGETTKAYGRGSHSEGSGTEATGEYSHAEGYHSYSTGDTAHSEGWNTYSLGRGSHSEGEESRAEAVGSHAEGYNSKALASYSHAEGIKTEAQGETAHSEGQNTKAIGSNSHAEGDTTIANGQASHSEGRQTNADGLYSHAEGYKSKVQTTAYTPPTGSGGGSGSGVPGEVEDDPTTRIGQGAHAEGILTISAGYATHTEGARTAASGEYTHAEGYGTFAKGSCTHAEGYNTTAGASFTHAEGYQTIVNHGYSHVEGYYTKSSREAQHIEGKFNADNPNALHIVGNGTSETDRKNAFEVLQDGRAKVQSAPKDNDDVVRKLEIDGKLTKPTNPSAESAVTMLADGTVGTKLLSEIGGGGKLYRHEVEVDYNDYISTLFMVFYTQNSTLINTLDKINNNSSTKHIICVYSGPNGDGSVIMQLNASTFSVHGVITYREGGTDTTVNVHTENVTPTQITDFVTEL